MVVGVILLVMDVFECDQVKVVNFIVVGKEGENILGYLNEFYVEVIMDFIEEYKVKVKVILVRY